MRFANTLPLIAAALVAGASNVLADDSADPAASAVLATQPDNAGTVAPNASKDGAWKEIRHFVGGYNFFELLNYPGARAHRHKHAQSSAAPGADPSTPAPTDSAGPASADLATGGGDAQLQPQEREFEDVEELEARKNHKKKHGKKHRKKKKHGGKKSHKKKHGKSHKKKHGKKKHHNKKKHGHKHDKKKHHHKREDEGVDMVIRAYEAGDIDARMFDDLVERYNVIGDPYLNTREFIDIDDLEAREFEDLFWE